MCVGGCHVTGSCPFACTASSEQTQNYGCLPTPADIIHMRTEPGRTWSCHCDITKLCTGAIIRLNELGHEHEVVDSDLLSEADDWHKFTNTKQQESE